jgi:hypothetical protein
MKKIAKLLKADFNESSDLASIAAMLASKGRGRDTILAHITPREADILKAAGGSGTTNPETGLLEFQEVDTYDIGFGPDTYAPADTGPAAPSPTNAQIEQQIGYQPTQAAPQVAPQTRSLAGGADVVQAPTQAAVAPVGTTGGAGQDVQLSSFPTQVAPDPFAGRAQALGETELTSPPPEKIGFLDKLTKGLTSEQMARLGLAGGLGLYGATQAKKGAQQAQAAAAEQKAVGAPYQAKGQELIRAAESGELTPTSQQQLQALQARLAQGAESRGGVGAAQVAAQTEAYRQQLLAQQYNLGLQVSNIGDQIALGAIKTGLAADQALNQASTNFYTNLAAIGAGIPITQTRTA